VDLLVREAGKTTADAAAEADLLPRKIAITLDQGLALTPLTPPATVQGVVWRARGVAVILGPFNFPLHLLHGLVAPALAVGCPVVAKPSERTPACGAFYASCLAEAGLDAWCAVVQGGADTARALIAAPGTATVAAVGSRGMGEALSRQLAGRPELVLALELGGVNHALLCADADFARAVPALADGAWRLAGQRCTATRVVHVPATRCAELMERLAAERQRWLPDGTPAGPMGPLIDASAAERFAAAWATAPATWQVWGAPRERRLQPASSAFCPPFLALADDGAHTLLRDEHFGPGLVVLPYTDEARAIHLMRANPHRLAAAVWTADRDRFLALAARLPYGLVVHNRNTAGARSDLPFGGTGHSGNGRPAALTAGQIFADQCVVG